MHATRALGAVLDDGMAMASSGDAMETIEGMIAALSCRPAETRPLRLQLQKLKAEIKGDGDVSPARVTGRSGEKGLPRNVGLIQGATDRGFRGLT